MQENKFAAFVMTFERPDVLMRTLDILLSQTFSPDYIFVVDNSLSFNTEKLLAGMSEDRIGYYRMGYNSGPAGAAKVGLQKLAEMGYEWIYWGDDDDPPSNLQVFEKCFKNLEVLKRSGNLPGIFGGKGGYLNKNTGRIRSLNNHELKQASFPEVDSVPGGHTMLINAAVVKQGILPNEKLFFGFEELDFCLRAKAKGFKIIIDADSWYKSRVKARNTKPGYQWKHSTFGSPDRLWREYYSSRNLLVILFSHKMYGACTYRIMVLGGKSVVGFKFGRKYGIKNFITQWRAIFDFLFKRFPKPVPSSKSRK